ncbi:hypothetical protein IG631_03172 [Alternaria alternata]|nr:hypothetical protein IG631_03172 [Alternaria alternata]
MMKELGKLYGNCLELWIRGEILKHSGGCEEEQEGREGAAYEGLSLSPAGTGDGHLIDHHIVVQSNRRET